MTDGAASAVRRMVALRPMRVAQPCSKMTRREALALGAAAGVAASVGAPATALAAASGAGQGVTEHLRRSTYAELVGESFSVGGHAVTLVAVEDVLGAARQRSLRGHEDAFQLLFEGDADALGSQIHEFFHPLVGPFALFAGPVGAVRGLRQLYGATVDRTVRLRSAAAAAPASRPAREPGRDEPDPEEAGEPSARDAEIVRAREAAAAAPLVRRRRAARRARRTLRRTAAERVRFKRKQRDRLRRTRRGWLRRHGR
jgi:hypothetical protein